MTEAERVLEGLADLAKAYDSICTDYPDAKIFRERLKIVLDATAIVRRFREFPLSAEEFTARMKEIAEFNLTDEEASHIMADELISEQLRSLGFAEAMNVYDDMHFWFA